MIRVVSNTWDIWQFMRGLFDIQGKSVFADSEDF